jgi:hypothetical protein
MIFNSPAFGFGLPIGLGTDCAMEAWYHFSLHE